MKCQTGNCCTLPKLNNAARGMRKRRISDENLEPIALSRGVRYNTAPERKESVLPYGMKERKEPSNKLGNEIMSRLSLGSEAL